MNATADAKGKLELLRLRGAAAGLERIPERAQADTATYRDFLECVLDAELRDRNERRLKRNLVAVEKGYKVCYERMTGLIKVLTRAELSRAAQFRLSRLTKSDLIIIDEIGYTPISRAETNLFFTFVSELYERASIVVTSNKGFESCAELLGDEVMTTALLDRLMHHARIFSLIGESYRISSRRSRSPSPS